MKHDPAVHPHAPARDHAHDAAATFETGAGGEVH